MRSSSLHDCRISAGDISNDAVFRDRHLGLIYSYVYFGKGNKDYIKVIILGDI
jgi:hypothetical protein